MISHVLGRKKKPKFWPKKIPKITKKKKRNTTGGMRNAV